MGDTDRAKYHCDSKQLADKLGAILLICNETELLRCSRYSLAGVERYMVLMVTTKVPCRMMIC